MESNPKRSGVGMMVSGELPENIDELLKHIFWKDPSLAQIAKEFLDHIKDWSRSDSPYTTSEWRCYCIKKEITQSRYHNMYKRLKNFGMIEKTYNKNRGIHEIHLTYTFSEYLSKTAKIWEDYI